MSRDPYGDRGPQRWDADRFTRETVRYEEDRSPRQGSGLGPRPRERSVDEVYERRVSGPRGYEEDDRVRERIVYDDDEPRYRPKRESVTIEKEREREVFNPPPRRAPRPGLLRRQSSLDTFDRRPFPRYEREEYGPPARREDFRPAYEPPPLPRHRALPPPRRYAERDFEEIKISEPDYYGDEEYRPYPERVREREIIRTRRRSRSRSRESAKSSSSYSTISSEEVVVEKRFPRRGKTRMPAKLVSLKAIIELGYPYEKEASVQPFLIHLMTNEFRAMLLSFKEHSAPRILTRLSSLVRLSRSPKVSLSTYYLPSPYSEKLSITKRHKILTIPRSRNVRGSVRRWHCHRRASRGDN
jgi:hypothetical protein